MSPSNTGTLGIPKGQRWGGRTQKLKRGAPGTVVKKYIFRRFFHRADSRWG